MQIAIGVSIGLLVASFLLRKGAASGSGNRSLAAFRAPKPERIFPLDSAVEALPGAGFRGWSLAGKAGGPSVVPIWVVNAISFRCNISRWCNDFAADAIGGPDARPY